MVVKYLLETLSALANKIIKSPAAKTQGESTATPLYKDGINYLNVSHTLRHFPRRRRWSIDLLPKSIIMAIILIALSSVKVMAAANDLTNLTVSTGALSPGFAAGTYSYNLYEGSATASITVRPTSAGSTITVNGLTVASGSNSSAITLTPGGTTTITIIATNASGTNFSTYTITVYSESITYPGATYVYANGSAITAITPTSGPDTPTGYTINPNVNTNTGLTWTASNGQISGTPNKTNGPTTYTITATYASGVTATTQISIQTGASKTVFISGVNVTQTYGSVTPTVTYTITGLLSGDSMVALPSVSTTATASSPAGTYPITVTGGQAPSGYTVNYVTGTFTISKANLNIVATGPPKSTSDDFTGVYPGASTAYFTANGLVNGETISSVWFTMTPPGLQSYNSNYTVSPGNPAVGANGFNSANYNISYTDYQGQVGQSYTWKGTTNSTWSTGTNWFPNGIPSSIDNVFIPDSTTLATPKNQPDLTASTVVNTITFQGKSRLTIEPGQTIQFLNGLTVSAMAKNVKAMINMRSTSSQVIVGTTSSHAIFDNLGYLTVDGGQVFITWGLNYVYNENGATMILQHGNTFNIGGTSGQLAFQNNGFFYAGIPNSNCTLNIVNSQSVINGSTGNFYLGSTSSINFLDPNAHDSHFTNMTNGNFTIQSDQFGSGAIGNIPAGPTNHKNSFDGLFTVERYISGNRGYRIMSSPVYAASVTTSGVTNKVYSLNYVQTFSYISGTSNTGGFDKVSQGPTLYLYREDYPVSNATFISGNFQSINNLYPGLNATPTYTFDTTPGSFSIPVSNGFLFYYRGDRNSPLGYTEPQEETAGAPAEPVVMSTTGLLTQQQVVFRDWYTPTSPSLGWSNPDVITAKGFNMVANPYACSIDWDTHQSGSTTTGIYVTGVSPTIWELNPVTQNYDSYTNSLVFTNKGTRTIVSGQAFFVQAISGTAQVIINESAKSTTLQNLGVYLLMGKPADALTNNQSLRLQMAKDTINTDDLFIGFKSDAKPTLDPMEDAAYKQGSGKVSISSMSSDHVPLAINFLPFSNKGQSIAIKVGATASGSYTLKLTEMHGIPQLFDIWLQDRLKLDSNDMRKNPTYTFDVDKTDTNSYGANRFAIVLRQNPAYAYQLLDFRAKKVPEAREVQVKWDTKYEENYTNFTVERSTNRGRSFEVLGEVTATGAGKYAYLDKHPVSGMNLYRLKQEDINNKITYSSVVPIEYSNWGNRFARGGINVFPNPLRNNIHVWIDTPVASPSSSYNISIANSYGLTLKTIKSSQPDWSGDVSDWQPGTYVVKVIDTKTQSLVGTTKFVKL